MPDYTLIVHSTSQSIDLLRETYPMPRQALCSKELSILNNIVLEKHLTGEGIEDGETVRIRYLDDLLKVTFKILRINLIMNIRSRIYSMSAVANNNDIRHDDLVSLYVRTNLVVQCS